MERFESGVKRFGSRDGGVGRVLLMGSFLPCDRPSGRWDTGLLLADFSNYNNRLPQTDTISLHEGDHWQLHHSFPGALFQEFPTIKRAN